MLLLTASDSGEIARLDPAQKSSALEVVTLVIVEAKDLTCALKEDEKCPETRGRKQPGALAIVEA